MKAQYTVLVTGIGGNVGQGILRNLAQAGLPLRLVGCNVTAVSAGNHLCNAVHLVPYAFHESYIPTMQAICKAEAVDLIIPSTDYEVYYLAANQAGLPKVAAMPAASAKIFLDKYTTWQHLAPKGVPFAASALPSAYDGSWGEVIVKPREGRGSRGLHINPPDPKAFDDSCMVQKLYRGVEVTSIFYVRQDGELHGHMTFERSLEGGATTFAEVTKKHDATVEPVIRALIAAMPITGSCNVQSIIDANGIIHPFEVNARISGTNSIRSQFGFTDVKWTAEEHLLGKAPEPLNLQPGCAVRILMDVIYPGLTLAEVQNIDTPHYLN